MFFYYLLSKASPKVSFSVNTSAAVLATLIVTSSAVLNANYDKIIILLIRNTTFLHLTTWTMVSTAVGVLLQME